MDQVASILLAFPPSEGFSDDGAYDLAAKAHVKRLNQLANDKAGALADHAAQVLQHVDPINNSISYLYILHTLFVGPGQQPGVPVDLLVNFVLKYDARQIRYAGLAFSDLLRALYQGGIVSPPIAVLLVSKALLRLDPTGGAFTCHHLPLVQVAYNNNAVREVLPTISKHIVVYPGIRGATETRPLCDARLPLSSYITIETGLTTCVSPSMVLEYDFCVGLCYLALQEWHLAQAAFERVMTYPSKDNGCSKIMVEAHNKWVLVSLLTKGRYDVHPAVSGSVQAAYAKAGRPYFDVVAAFKKPDNAAGLRDEVNSAGMQVWAAEANQGLIGEVLAHYQRHHVMRLSDIYSKLSIENIRTLTQSALTGTHLASPGETEQFLNHMISTGALKGVITKPEGSTVGDGQGYLTFTEEQEQDEQEYMGELTSLKEQIQSLGSVLKAADERLTTSRDYVKHLVKNESGGKDRLAPSGASSGAGREVSYDSQVEDEDLMTAS